MEDLKLLPEMEDKILPFLDDICSCSLYIAKISQISSKIGRYLFVLNNLPHLDDLWPSQTFQFWNANIARTDKGSIHLPESSLIQHGIWDLVDKHVCD